MSDPVHDLFGRPVRLPDGFSRQHRIQLVGEVFQALIDGRLPSREAALFVGGAGAAWLSEGGDLVRDYLRVAAPRSSHHTPQHLWREACSSGGATDGDEPETMNADNIDDEGSA